MPANGRRQAFDEAIGKDMGATGFSARQNQSVVESIVMSKQILMSLQLTDAQSRVDERRSRQNLASNFAGIVDQTTHLEHDYREGILRAVTAEILLLEKIKESRIDEHACIRTPETHHHSLDRAHVDLPWLDLRRPAASR